MNNIFLNRVAELLSKEIGQSEAKYLVNLYEDSILEDVENELAQPEDCATSILSKVRELEPWEARQIITY